MMPLKILFGFGPLFLAAVLLGFSGCEKPTPPVDPIEDQTALIAKLDADIPALMEKAQIPGLSIAIVKDGEVIWAKGFGVTDLDNPAPVTPDTVFEAASLGKPLFALAYLKVRDREGLDLDRPLAETFAYDRLANDKRNQTITPRMILSHRTGFPNWDRVGKLDLVRDPGTRFGYSGEGFVYLEKFLEDRTGTPVNDLAKEEIFDPLGMTRSGYVWKKGMGASFAEGHFEDGKVRPSPRYKDANAAATLMTTSRDYARFLIYLMSGGGLNSETFEEVLKPQVRMTARFNGRQGPKEVWSKIAWGLGWGIQNDGKRTIYWHWGDNRTYRAFAAFDLARKTGFVYLTNSENGLAVANAIAGPIVGDMHWTMDWLGYRQEQ